MLLLDLHGARSTDNFLVVATAFMAFSTAFMTKQRLWTEQIRIISDAIYSSEIANIKGK